MELLRGIELSNETDKVWRRIEGQDDDRMGEEEIRRTVEKIDRKRKDRRIGGLGKESLGYCVFYSGKYLDSD